MGVVVLPNMTQTNGDTVLATHYQQNDAAIIAQLNGNLTFADNFKLSGAGAGISNGQHGDLSAYTTTTHHAAASAKLADTTLGANVELAIAKIKPFIVGATPAMKYIGYDFDETTAANVSVAVPASAATAAILVEFGMHWAASAEVGDYIELTVILSDGTNTAALSTHAAADNKFRIFTGHNGGDWEAARITSINAVNIPNAHFTWPLAWTNTYTLTLTKEAVGHTGSNYWMRVSVI